MGKTSAAVKNRWIDKKYDRINLTVPKGRKAEIQAHAEQMGVSVNSYINRLIDTDMARDKQKES